MTVQEQVHWVHFMLFGPEERRFAAAASALATANPFRPIEVRKFEDEAAAIELPCKIDPLAEIAERPRISLIVGKAAGLLKSLRGRKLPPVGNADADLYAGLVRFVLYFQFRDHLQESVEAGFSDPQIATVPWLQKFRSRFGELSLVASSDDPLTDAGHVIACFFQIRRAYHLIYSQLIGTSHHIEELRATAWESVFTSDMEQYGRLLYDRMHDFTTLIVGPSGTGKELVATAIGLSRYIPFDTRTSEFVEPFAGAFRAVNLSALSPTLIEAELFGHAEGAFTGATSARAGWFESCRVGHSVFLDEIGELEPALQVKLLRVLQERVFQRIGELQPRRFDGKVIAATNRDLAEELASGRFRQDFYYRLCSDVIRTPSLKAQLDASPQDIETIVSALVRRQIGQDIPEVVAKVTAYIQANLADHHWPGNVRELEQCIRSVLVRGKYAPTITPGVTSRDRLMRRLEHETLDAESLLNAYCRVLYDELGTYSEVGRVLGLDRRTVQRRVDS